MTASGRAAKVAEITKRHGVDSTPRPETGFSHFDVHPQSCHADRAALLAIVAELEWKLVDPRTAALAALGELRDAMSPRGVQIVQEFIDTAWPKQ